MSKSPTPPEPDAQSQTPDIESSEKRAWHTVLRPLIAAQIITPVIEFYLSEGVDSQAELRRLVESSLETTIPNSLFEKALEPFRSVFESPQSRRFRLPTPDAPSNTPPVSIRDEELPQPDTSHRRTPPPVIPQSLPSHPPQTPRRFGLPPGASNLSR